MSNKDGSPCGSEMRGSRHLWTVIGMGMCELLCAIFYGPRLGWGGCTCRGAIRTVWAAALFETFSKVGGSDVTHDEFRLLEKGCLPVICSNLHPVS